MSEEKENTKAVISAFIDEDEQNLDLMFDAMLDLIIRKNTMGKFKDLQSFASSVQEFPHRKHGKSTATFNELDKILIARFKFTELEVTTILDALCKQKYIYYNSKDNQFWFYQ